MGTKYGLLKATAIAGTILSICRVFFESLLLEDYLIVVLTALLLVAIAKEAEKAKQKTGLFSQTIGEAVKEQLAGV